MYHCPKPVRVCRCKASILKRLSLAISLAVCRAWDLDGFFIRRFKMFQKIKALFRSTPRQAIVPFVDPVLGEFAFDADLGWKKRVHIGDTEIEVVIGSDGEIPSDEMVRIARMWVQNWTSEKPRLLDYIRNELAGWKVEPGIPDPDRFTLDSINVLWPDHPNTCMIYLNCPGDEYRGWHITLDDRTPRGFAYDD